MMGVSHAVSGMAAGALLLPVAPVPGPAGQVAWVAAWGGFALLPDLDQGGVKGGRVHGSSAARTWGPFTALAASLVGRVADGHRNGTHSLLGVAVFTMAGFAATLWRPTAAVLVALAVGLALRGASWLIPGRREKDWLFNMVVSAVCGWLAVYGLSLPDGQVLAPVGVGWLPVAVAGGSLVHIAGDMLTPQGCPLLWPLDRRRFGVGVFTTSTWVEAWLVVPALAGLVVVGAAWGGLLDPVLDAGSARFGGEGFSWGVTVAGFAAVAALLAHREMESSR